MTSHFKTALTIAVAAALLQACSWFKDKQPEYLESREGQALKVPGDLDEPRPVSPVMIRIENMRLPQGDELRPMPPNAAVTAGGGQANAYMAWSSDGAFLAVKDTPESVSRRLRYAIERSGMKLVKQDENGAHLFEYVHQRIPQEKSFFQKILFWRSNEGPDYSGTYQLKLEPNGKETRVFLRSQNGDRAETNTAEYVLGAFMERLG